MSVEVTNYGAILLSVKVPGKASPAEEVTLCHSSLEALQADSPYYGATIGRVANRIASGRFHAGGKEYNVATNNGANHLHGGVVGFDKVLWSSRLFTQDGAAGVVFSYVSHDGEEGYPGRCEIESKYTLTAANELVLEFSATTDKPTPINLCNHAYWNLSGGLRDKVYDHVLQSACTHYLPVDKTSIPTGEVAPVAGTPFDFSQPKRVGEQLYSVDGGGQPGYDHCLARAGLGQVPAQGLGFGPIAVLSDPKSGRVMTVSTDQPGVQLYTGNFLSGAAPHDQHHALCLETQAYPDAINQKGFPSALLQPGEKYHTRTVHGFSW